VILAFLEIQNLSFTLEGHQILHNLSLGVERGEFFTLLGPSGCGKTTLLRAIAGFVQPSEGNIVLNGKSLLQDPPEKRPVHTVFQSYALFPHMTIAENIAFPLVMKRQPRAVINQKVKDMLALVRLPTMEKRYPDELSGGQKQRVALARSLIAEPMLLLLDEPLAALDLQLREEMQRELIALQKRLGITFIYVTHDQGEALSLSHRIAVMQEGQIAQIDSPINLYEYPKNRFVADFVGMCNIFTATVIDWHEPGVAHLEVENVGTIKVKSAKKSRASKVYFIIRPEKITVQAPKEMQEDQDWNHLPGVVLDHLYLGDVTIARIKLEKGAVVEAMIPNIEPGYPFLQGEKVALAFRLDAGRLLDD
jgi:spermidine/putrescine transport system ATP-binding protein